MTTGPTESPRLTSPVARTPSAAADRPWWRLRRTDLLALLVWGASRVAVLVISLAALATQHGTSWLGLWLRWDTDRYITIAEYGYTSGKGPAYDSNIVAFFPGYPMVLRAVHLMVRDWAASGLLISLVAGGVACVALARLAEFEWRARRRADDEPGGSGRVAVTAVLLLVCAPAAVFLAAGYTESLFLTLGIPAWLAARRRRWVLACVLTGLACSVRVDGAFEAAGIGIMFLLSRPKARDWARLPAFALPLAAVGGYFAYLEDIKGDWLAWFTAEKQGWARQLTSPITAFRTSWANAFGSGRMMMGGRKVFRGPGSGRPDDTFGGGPGGGFKPGGSGLGQSAGPGGGGFGRLQGTGPFGPWPYRLDILMIFVGFAFMGWAAFRRRWAELTYVGLAVVALATSTYYMSVAREALLWWPVMIALALWLSTRRRWLTGLCTGASAVMMIGVSWLFLTGSWAG